jgi:hypothetical protein
MIERLERWHWWKMQRKERKAKVIPTRVIKIQVAIRQVVRATRLREARFCAARSVDESPSGFAVNGEPFEGG